MSFFISLPAWSIAFIEPGIGIKSGNYKSEENQFLTNMDEGWARGGTLFIRGGYSGDLIFAGLDFGVQVLGLEASYANTDNNAGYIGAMVGAIVGIHIPVLPFRVWGGVYATGMGTSHEETIIRSRDEISVSGSAVKLGIGFRPLPLMSLNIEFCQETFKNRKHKLTIGNITLVDDDVELDNKPVVTTAIFSISIPIDW